MLNWITGLTAVCLFALSAVHSEAAPGVVSVENAGLLFTDNQAGMSGMDCGYSLPIGDRTLWLFGDVFLLDPKSPEHNYIGGVSNCAALVPAGKGMAPLRRYTVLTDPEKGIARQVIPNLAGEGNELRFWPFGGWYDAAAHRVYVYYARIRTTGKGPLDFRTEGHGLAWADTSVPEKMVFQRIKADGDELWWKGDNDGILFGTAVVAPPKDDYIYVFGLQDRKGKHVVKLARVSKAHIADRAAYEYLSAIERVPEWSRDIRQAMDVEGLEDFSEASIAYNAYLGGYLAVHSIGIFSQKARLSLAANPWGPYRSIGEIGTPHQAFAQAFTYAGKEHPELAEENGRIIYVTYTDNQRYWLQMLKVTLSKDGRISTR